MTVASHHNFPVNKDILKGKKKTFEEGKEKNGFTTFQQK
jgi:hypothetical protein